MEKKSEFYTLKGYKMRQNVLITEAMEDYLEMIFRMSNNQRKIRIKDLAHELNVNPSSASKMVSRLKEQDLVISKKYSEVNLTANGQHLGEYFLWRHNILVKFFKYLNKENYILEQVEKIEHFIDNTTLNNMEEWLKNID